jgi:hypothetical protein
MAKKKTVEINSTDGAVRELSKLFTSFHRHGTYQVFTDFLSLSACAISNALDRRFYDEREKHYMDTIKRYSKEEADKFPQMLGLLVQAFEPLPGVVVYRDVLGELFMSLELGNEWSGQFFTPYPVALLKAQMVLGDADSLRAEIKGRGFVRAMEPAVGGGALVIATADAFQQMGVNYQQHLHFTCIDVDIKAVQMAYIQLSLLHIPAVIVHGNALSAQEWSQWHTPAHLHGFWDARLRRESDAGETLVQEIQKATRTEPVETVSGIEEQEDTLGQMTLF